MKTNIRNLVEKFGAESPTHRKIAKFIDTLKDGEVVDSDEIIRRIRCGGSIMRPSRLPAHLMKCRWQTNLEQKRIVLWANPKTLEKLKQELSKNESADQGSL